MNTQQINNELKIVKLGTQKFRTEGGYYQPTGYALKHPKLGYFSFAEDNNDYPYSPVGGRKALKSIMDAGGLTSFHNAKWLQEMA